MARGFKGQKAYRGLSTLLVLLQLGAAAAIIGIIAARLSDSVTGGSAGTNGNDSASINLSIRGRQCLLGYTGEGVNLCYFGYGAAAASILVTLILGLLTCLTCNLCGLGPILDIIMAAIGTLWWVAVALVFWFYQRGFLNSRLPERGWQVAVWALCWALAGLFFLWFLTAFAWSCAFCCAKCCGKGRRRHEHATTPVGDVEAPYGHQKVAVPVAHTDNATYYDQGAPRPQFVTGTRY